MYFNSPHQNANITVMQHHFNLCTCFEYKQNVTHDMCNHVGYMWDNSETMWDNSEQSMCKLVVITHIPFVSFLS